MSPVVLAVLLFSCYFVIGLRRCLLVKQTNNILQRRIEDGLLNPDIATTPIRDKLSQ